MKRLALLTAVLFVSGWAGAQVKTETVSYKQGSTVLKGYLAYDDALQGKRPGVIVVPEWWGLNDFPKRKAEDLAHLGYVAFAADVYGNGQVAKDTGEAGKLSTLFKSNRPLLRSRVTAALKTLQKQPMVDDKKIAAIGFCFGGTTVLELARSGADVLGVVSFHGGLDTPNPADAKQIKGKVLALHGGDDPYVTWDAVNAFIDEMKKAGVDWQLSVFAKAVHGFTNPANGNDNSKGAAYNELAARRAWDEMKMFLGEIFL